MIEKWTEFQGEPNGAGREKARVTLNSKGVVHLNKHAYEAFGRPAAVKLMYEEDRRVIGLKADDPGHKNAFPLKQKNDSEYRMIYASPFCRHFGIGIRRTVLFNDIDIDREGMMRLELSRTQQVGRPGK